ncbi:DUF262 domain-containing protein [Escherichia fergusonii]|uniref:DUF262 domain-containing protein n=1 Tax=Escherichia fergusonii TaxID=564 RepID=UPI001E30643E|nr:DUF262 domain-containing protein [Escherichia fergusonii]MCC8287197.1 DUF262 domain-containing HNH endonuclease family protein [Escherichia fergusonii]MCC8289850.1 DUF262 domain-containing HNH endonuclease family protein [Escherichia fergusonii]MCC8315184.1 DUF262 domain-containing HNH endonuclease family protein [Escherichia fergusonii]
MDKEQGVKTEILTLETVLNKGYQFSIPSYQRPYVWSDDDVLLLFNDIKDACFAGDKNYFIGTVLSSLLEQNTHKIYELIDGQQRTTTLMLIAIAFKTAGSKTLLADVIVYENKPRLQFAIREQVQNLLGSLAGLKSFEKPSDESIAQNHYLKQLDIALTVLTKEIAKLKQQSVQNFELLGKYIFSQVQWVNNVVPVQMDLNRLFATMNTTGIQLEQTDILKAKLLKRIKTHKSQYEAIWVSCEHMENYFERNVRKTFKKADWKNIQPQELSTFSLNKFTITEEPTKKNDSGLSIAQLAEQIETQFTPEDAVPEQFESDELDIETVYCRSIIGFPLLLIHAYRVFLALNEQEDIIPRLHSDRLLEIFEPLINSDECTVKDFIEMLWQVRYQFDTWVVKWVEKDDNLDAHLALANVSRSISKGKYYLNRSPKPLSDLVMLQSVRNFTGERSAQYWLTPFIASLIRREVGDTEDKRACRILERIDNRMSLALDSQKEASFKQAKWLKPKTKPWDELVTYFNESHGIGFEHYWFQKLEYILWKSLNNTNLPEKDLIKFEQYRITSKNSVEHVHPQQEEYGNRLTETPLNSFGNLVLLSPGDNSSYSNQSVAKKKADFEAKPRFDSLKLRAIFRSKTNFDEGWTEKNIKNHKNAMIQLLTEHYGKNSE